MNYITIKNRMVPFPMHTNEALWENVRNLIELETEKNEPLTHIEICIGFLGEDEAFWRDYKNVAKWMEWAQLLYQIWLNIKVRGMRNSLSHILYSEYSYKKIPWYKRFWIWWNRVILKREKYIDHLPNDSIIFEEKQYDCPPDLLWVTVGQYQDGLELLKYLHEETTTAQRNEIIEKIFKIFFYPVVSGDKYSVEKAMEWDIGGARGARYVDVEDFGSFFLRKLIAFQLGTKKSVRK